MKTGRCELCMEDAEARGSRNRAHSPSGRELPVTGFGCAVCKVYICKKCFASGEFVEWRHPGDTSVPSPHPFADLN